jgi:hypothetical protein
MQGITSITGGSGAKEGKTMDHLVQIYLQNPDALHALVKAAVAGDTSVLPDINTLLDTLPAWATALGDSRQQLENTLLDLMTGSNLLQREAVKRALDTHEQRLAEEPSYVETLLIQQIRLDLLMLHGAQKRALEHRDMQSDKLLSSAHRRLLSSLKSLEQLRKLAPPIRIQVAHNQVNLG